MDVDHQKGDGQQLKVLAKRSAANATTANGPFSTTAPFPENSGELDEEIRRRQDDTMRRGKSHDDYFTTQWRSYPRGFQPRYNRGYNSYYRPRGYDREQDNGQRMDGGDTYSFQNRYNPENESRGYYDRGGYQPRNTYGYYGRPYRPRYRPWMNRQPTGGGQEEGYGADNVEGEMHDRDRDYRMDEDDLLHDKYVKIVDDQKRVALENREVREELEMRNDNNQRDMARRCRQKFLKIIYRRYNITDPRKVELAGYITRLGSYFP